MRVPCWTLYRSVRDTTRPTDKTRTAIEKALLRIAVPHLDPFRFRPLLHHDVDFLSPAHTRDVHRDLCAAVERDVRRSVWTQDRKSTRLNSSHLVISYAVFCLK